ncbi:MAG: methylated-DNA--[protein]-cysteine S-methyltransferase [Ancrocorticia sp.]|nr:methylated-DNA--[protein]-cysteine S-methyltransferase [Ancrocorticia sp.]MCI2193080.1 methylated-DNA--[protein]-cysteine S-methyltransferase [Ancrocorticia sp.]MCI2198439.1 methylated-DNA--[protein]-cysteine S-methyltransferase [Ancrocorticia sp.]
MIPNGAVVRTAVASSVGSVVLTSNGDALTSIAFDGAAGPGAMESCVAPDAVTRTAIEWLRAYFAGDRPRIQDVPLQPEGTEFQQCVWQALRQIPYGTTRSYGSIAAEVAHVLGKERMAAQAIGGAVGRNPLPIIVPCHRVVGTRGKLTGYAGGLGRKVALLQLEGVDVGRFSDAPPSHS